jgi:drug/metabolite transporter (DMT)-like permease
MNNSLLYLVTVLIWGSTWIAINYQLGSVAPEASLFYRFGLAALLLFCYCRFKHLTLCFNVKQHVQFIFFGLTLFGCNYYFLYSAQQHINSALTCIGFSLIMFFNIINARLWYKTKISLQVYAGGLLGLAGIVTLFWPQINNTNLGEETIIGLSLCLIGTLFASTGNMLSMRNKILNLPMLQANAWGMAYGATFMAIMVLIQGKSFNFEVSMAYISSLLYLSIFGSIVAFGCYLTLLNRIGAHKASYATIMFPAVAVVISTFVEDFQWNSYTIMGLLIILVGNLVVLMKPKKRNDKITTHEDSDLTLANSDST